MRNYYQSDCPACGHHRNGRHRNQGCGMRPELRQALKDYAAANGPRWKSKLRELWMSGKDEGALREIRNIVGAGSRRLEKIEKGWHARGA